MHDFEMKQIILLFSVWKGALEHEDFDFIAFPKICFGQRITDHNLVSLPHDDICSEFRLPFVHDIRFDHFRINLLDGVAGIICWNWTDCVGCPNRGSKKKRDKEVFCFHNFTYGFGLFWLTVRLMGSPTEVS